MQTDLKHLYAFVAALVTTAILVAPVAAGEGSGVAFMLAITAPVVIA